MITEKLYGSPKSVDERHRHRYEINPDYVQRLEEAGLKFVGTDEENKRMEIVELDNHPYYVGVQYHPEYLSRPLKPSPPFMGLILASVGKLKGYLNKGCRLSPREMSDNSSGRAKNFKFLICYQNGIELSMSNKPNRFVFPFQMMNKFQRKQKSSQTASVKST